MRIICVDDEPLAMEYTVGQCRLLPRADEVKGFTSAQEALDYGLIDHIYTTRKEIEDALKAN